MGGYLEKYVRQYSRLQEKKDARLGCRLSKRLYNEFIDHCTRLGISHSEAMVILIERELAEAAEDGRDRRRKRPSN